MSTVAVQATFQGPTAVRALFDGPTSMAALFTAFAGVSTVDGKSGAVDLSGTYLARTNNLGDVEDVDLARNNLGLGLADDVEHAKVTAALVGTVNGVTQTTVGGNFLGLTNPGAIRFVRINADNTVTARTAAEMRTDLGATTVGGNLFTLTNPGATTFPRFNSDNTVTALNATSFRSAIGIGTIGTQNSSNISITGGSISGASLVPRQIANASALTGEVFYSLDDDRLYFKDLTDVLRVLD